MAFTHPIAAAAIAAPFYRKEVPLRVWLCGAFLTALPDADFLGWQLGVPYGHPVGHRGFTHSLFFAAVMALVSALYFRKGAGLKLGVLWSFFFLCGASHGLLDGMTNGGLGVAYFAPFDNTRYWMPWRPIPVAPLGPRLIFSGWGWRVFKAELVYLWVPCLLFAAAVLALRWPRRGRGTGSGL
jgi:inner membrane protein